MLGSLIIYLKGMRRMMFQLSGFYYKPTSLRCWVEGFRVSGSLAWMRNRSQLVYRYIAACSTNPLGPSSKIMPQ